MSLGLRRLWRKLDEFLPTLNKEEQEAIQDDMRYNAVADVDFYVLIFLASSIAYLGLRQNSGAVIIGAMLVAPLMSPMMAIGFGIVRNNSRMIRVAVRSTLAGILLAVATSTLVSFILPAGVVSNEILARTSPNLFDLLIALVSGAAGAYALGRKEVSASLPGVAISASLVPPLCVVGYGLGTRQFDLSYGAGLLFITNLGSIILAGIMVFALLGFQPRNFAGSQTTWKAVRWTISGILLVSIPLVASTIDQARDAQRLAAVEAVLKQDLDASLAEIEDIVVKRSGREYVVGFTAYVYNDARPETDVAELQAQLEQAVGASVEVRARVIAATLGILDSEGLHQP